MTATTNVKNLRQYKSRFSLIVELILRFNSGANVEKLFNCIQI